MLPSSNLLRIILSESWQIVLAKARARPTYRHYRLRAIRELLSLWAHERSGRSTPQVCLVYDNSVSPHTYGDFLASLMVLRYFSTQGWGTKLLIADDSRRHDWQVLNSQRQNFFVHDQLRLTKIVCPDTDSVLTSTSIDFGHRLQILDGNAHLLFRWRTIKREQTYAFSWSLLSLLIKVGGTPDGFLLSRDSLGLPDDERIPANIIAWHIRREKYGEGHNTSNACIRADAEDLIREFNPRNILILGTTEATTEAMVLLRDQVYGADDFSSKFSTYGGQGFIDSMLAVLRSDFFYQRPWGGLMVAAIFSSVPYLLIHPLNGIHEAPAKSRDGSFPWSQPDQCWLVAGESSETLRIRDIRGTR